MWDALPPNFVLPPVSSHDLIVASLAFGFTLGFGWLAICTAVRQTWVAYRRTGRRVFHNAYIWMIWVETIVCTIFSFICYLYLKGIIPPSLAFYITIVTLWALQIQLLLQIIINRCGLIVADKRLVRRLKIGVAVLITAVNISVYSIWIPARMQIPGPFAHTNTWWDRCEKVIYAISDGCLNVYFIWLVQKRLVSSGLEKYRRLAKFNTFIIAFSMSMDVFIIGMMSLSNTFVYMQIHPLAYMVKLKIEMSMAELIGLIAREKRIGNNMELMSSVARIDRPLPWSSQINSTSPIVSRRPSSCPEYTFHGTDERLTNPQADVAGPSASQSAGWTTDRATGLAFQLANNMHTTTRVHMERDKATHQRTHNVSPTSSTNGDDDLTLPSQNLEWDYIEERSVR
ncbi:hypothetical protein GGR57DRAFT_514496 [Xylariaceae sp. FL1272]|nr:hypothetical protein GGR57DRAFT_514496 [Xylariaceae sp. FL1272]